MKHRPDSPQLTIDWTAALAEPPAIISATPPADVVAEVPSVSPAAEQDTAAVAGLVQVLPWDFCTTFPPVMQDAIDVGIIHEDDALAENLASLHEEHANVCLAALSDMEVIQDARRQGVDPKTGQKPRSESKQRELENRLSQEVLRLQRWQQTLLDTYEGVFGADAANAFDKYIRARHAGIPVMTGAAPVPSSVAAELPVGKPRSSSIRAGCLARMKRVRLIQATMKSSTSPKITPRT